MILVILQILFPIEQGDRMRRSLSMWLHTDAQAGARRFERQFSRAMVVAAAGLVLMMIARIVAAWAAGRL